MICYLSKNYKGTASAGNKAKTDIERVMDRLGYRNVGYPTTYYSNSVLSFFITLAGVLKAPFYLHRGDVLVLQYPLKKYYDLLCWMAHRRGAKVVTLIHDLGSFRRQKLTVAAEMKRLNHSDYIITHNSSMTDWLKKAGCLVKMGELEIFDYLSETMAESALDLEQGYRVVYAGALALRKNAFLYGLGSHIHHYGFELYGNGFEVDRADGKEHFHYRGFVSSDELIATVKGHFGLVWDGSSIEACAGNWGEYLKYNNPHKTSLYIRCELPIIIWEKAALAGFVRQQGIGICISSLQELDRILTTLTEDQYAEMKKNIRLVSSRLASGHYTMTAINRAIQTLEVQ